MKLVHVFDAYCGWSHGFTATLREITSRHPDLPVEVVSGGLFTGPGRVPIREVGYVQGANAKIAVDGDSVTPLAYGHATADEVAEHLAAHRASPVSTPSLAQRSA